MGAESRRGEGDADAFRLPAYRSMLAWMDGIGWECGIPLMTFSFYITAFE